jgi:hypothetical protein
MSSLRDEAAHWFARAAEVRTPAARIADPEAKRKMLELANNCTTIARPTEVFAARARGQRSTRLSAGPAGGERHQHWGFATVCGLDSIFGFDS